MYFENEEMQSENIQFFSDTDSTQLRHRFKRTTQTHLKEEEEKLCSI